MNEKRSIESCMFQVLKEEEINLARKEGAITELEKRNRFVSGLINFISKNATGCNGEIILDAVIDKLKDENELIKELLQGGETK